MNKYKIFLCLLVRYSLAFFIKTINIKYLSILSLPAIIISFGFFRNYLNYKPGDKGFAGGNVWWNDYRLFHSFMFAIFSILALYKNKNAWIILLIDAIFGTIFFSRKYLFKKMK